jgi:predicted transcriptional regulator
LHWEIRVEKIGYPSNASQDKTALLEWTSNIVSAYLNKNQTDLTQLPRVMETVYSILSSLGENPGVENLISQRLSSPGTAANAEKSITPDYLVCLEDGVRLKTLKRYLFRKYGMTPEQYRNRWNLPPDYPMVAPNYAAKRSALAHQMGLGRKTKKMRRDKPARKSASRRAGA